MESRIFFPGGGLPVKQGDSIEFSSVASSVFGLKLNLLLVDKQGNTSEKSILNTSLATRATASTNENLVFEGWIISAGVDITSGALPAFPGALFTWAYLRGSGRTLLATLLSGYIYQAYPPPSFPNGQLNAGIGPVGTGRLYTASGADPAAGAEVADTVPAGAKWLLLALEVVLVTDGTAANRNTNLFIDDAATTITRNLLLTDTTNQTATLTRTHGWYPGTDNDSTASVSVTDGVTLLAKYPMSLQGGIMLRSGSNIRTVTTGIVAGDNYGAARYIVEEWITG